MSEILLEISVFHGDLWGSNISTVKIHFRVSTAEMAADFKPAVESPDVVSLALS